MSSTVLLSKGAGQIYIMAVTAEGRGVDDDMPPYTRTFVLALYNLSREQWFFKNRTLVFFVNKKIGIGFWILYTAETRPQ